MATRGSEQNQLNPPTRRDAEREVSSIDSQLSPALPSSHPPQPSGHTHVSPDAIFASTEQPSSALSVTEWNSNQESEAISSTLVPAETSTPEPETERRSRSGRHLLNASGQCACGHYSGLTQDEMCSVCKMPKLHPTDQEQRERHEKECLSAHIRQSMDKECAVCLENIFEKEGLEPDKKFGILENCDHSFCTSCIQNWRDIQPHRCCPMCRTYSDIMMPSQYWIVCPEEKRLRFDLYKHDALQEFALRQLFCLLML